MFDVRVTKTPVELDKDEHGEVDLLHATERDGRGAAFKVSVAAGDRGKSRLNRHRHPFDLQVLQPELPRDRFADLLAQIDGVAERLLGVVDEGKRPRIGAVGDADRLGGDDGLQAAIVRHLTLRRHGRK